MHPLLRKAAGAITDLGYLLAAGIPGLRGVWRVWAGAWYPRLARSYQSVVDADPAYFVPLNRILPDLPQAARIVEVGAGTGAATGMLRRRFPNAYLVAVDLTPRMLASLPAADVCAVVGDAFALPVRGGIADLAFVHNAPFAPEELLRILKPGGAAVVVLSRAGWLPGRLARALALRPLHAAVVLHERRAGAGVAWVLTKRDG